MRALGIYVYAGGFSVGVRKEFEIVAHFEEGPFGGKTVERNLGVPVYSERPWPWEVADGVDFVYCNPPCAPWSAAGSRIKGGGRDYGSRGYDPRDERVAYVARAFEALERLSPKAWLWESVTRAFTAGRAFMDGYARRALDLGYAVSVVLHDGFDCGVPQHRKRVFFVAHRVQIPWARPAGVGPRTVGEVLDALNHERVENEESPAMYPIESECLDVTPPGGRLMDAYDVLYGKSLYDEKRRRHAGRPGFLRRRAHREKHCPTLTGSPTIYHPEEHRYLSIQEYAAMCGYPRDYEFVGSTHDRYAQTAKAVMPPVGRWVAGLVARGVERGLPAVSRYRLYDFIKRDGNEPDTWELDPPPRKEDNDV